MPDILKVFGGIFAGALIAFAVKFAYDRYVEGHVVKTDDSGYAVAQVVASRLYEASDLRVSLLQGTVQGVAVDARFFDLLHSQRIMKAPFQVGYFVDLGQLRPADFRYDARSRTLLVDVPAVRVEEPDIDETRISLDRTSGWFVTREAMIVLQRNASISASRSAAATARTSKNLALAKDSARRAIAALFAGSLRAAGLDATVQVHMADDPRDTDERWDTTRSIADVLVDRHRILDPHS